MASKHPQLNDKAWLTRRYVTEGASTRDIAAELGCQKETVRRALAVNGIHIRAVGTRVSPDVARLLGDAEWLARRYLIDGATCRALAAEIGCSESTVLLSLVRHGMAIRRSSLPKRTRDRLDDREWLSQRYLADGASTIQIAAQLRCDHGTVANALTRHSIPIRPQGRRHGNYLDNPEWLRERYLVNQVSTTAIAEEIGCAPATVNAALRAHGIEVRPPRPIVPPSRISPANRARLADADWMRRRYIADGASTSAIAAELDCSTSTVWIALRRHGISVRRPGPRLTKRTDPMVPVALRIPESAYREVAKAAASAGRTVAREILARAGLPST